METDDEMIEQVKQKGYFQEFPNPVMQTKENLDVPAKLALEWRIEIVKASNGYVLKSLEETDEGTIREVVEVCEDKLEDETDSVRSMLWCVLEHFGVYNGIKIIQEKDEVERTASIIKKEIKELERELKSIKRCGRKNGN